MLLKYTSGLLRRIHTPFTNNILRRWSTSLTNDAYLRNVRINGREVLIRRGTTVYNACKQQGIPIPTLCHHPRLDPVGACRVCLVKLEGSNKFIPSCSTVLTDDMSIVTNTSDVRENIQGVLSLLLADHASECATCSANGNCTFQDLIDEFDVENKFPAFCAVQRWDHSSQAVQLNMDKCIRCSLCIRACSMQGMDILGMVGRGVTESPAPQFDMPLSETNCIECGQCTWFCPTGAIKERSDWRNVLADIRSQRYIMVAQTAPSVRVAAGELLGMEPGAVATDAMVDCLRQCGFNYVFDTNFAADLTIMEEGYELLDRVKNGGVFPQFTSCCPGWVTMVEKMYPQLIPHLSSAKSPQQMMGACVKNLFAKKLNVPASRIKLVSIMPCTAKKSEATRHHTTGTDGVRVPDVDYVLTTREMGKMFKHCRVKANSGDHVNKQGYDSPLGESTGAAAVFGVTGGVMEAALRTAYEVYSGQSLPKIEFDAVRGLDFIKSTTVKIPNRDNEGDALELRCAVVHGAANTQRFLSHIEKTGEQYHFVEVMQCPGGCIGGGGQPQSDDPEILKKRMRAVYSIDDMKTIRKSHENPDIVRIYDEWLQHPLSHTSHSLLHTKYHPFKPSNATKNDP